MRAEDRPAFLEVLIGFAEIKGKQLSAAALQLYWAAMQAWSLEDFRQCATVLLRTCEWFPSPAEFERVRRAHQQTAQEAWVQVLEWVRASGYRSVVPAHLLPPCPSEAAQQAVRVMGGWEAIGLAELPELGFLEHRFIEHFEHARDSASARGELEAPANVLRLPRGG